MSEKKETKAPEIKKETESTTETAPDTLVKPGLKTAVVYNCQALRVRVQPDPDAAILTAIHKGEPVEIDRMEKEWAHVRTEGGTIGWARREYLKED